MYKQEDIIKCIYITTINMKKWWDGSVKKYINNMNTIGAKPSAL